MPRPDEIGARNDGGEDDEMVQVDSGFQRNDVEGAFRPRFQCGAGFSPE